MKISATLVTLNEEKNLPRALKSLRCCDEVVVVDSGSQDRTREIAEEFGAKLLHRDWTGYADQKNFAARAASHDWILSLDADEELSDDLLREIIEVQKSEPDVAGFRFPRRARYLGKWIHHSGWYPDRKIRLYDRRKASWTGDYVHEFVVTTGPVTELRGDLLHYTCDSFSQHLATLDRYTDLAANEMLARGTKAGLWRLILDPPWTFFKTYLIQRGFLDGRQGLTISYAAALYVFRKYAKARIMAARAMEAGR
ncbi:MAG: glycosyltransferase family 2 protein [Acidobacteria bacterium]|nr:glycosyltransferase family 2 protein [Acidobacteriota bacterium]